MNLKLVATIMLTALPLLSAASTTIECSGNGQSIRTQFNQNTSQTIQSHVSLTDSSGTVALSQKMKIEINILPAGTFLSVKEIREYRGSYIANELKFGFWISQAFDSNNKMVIEYKNIFGMNQKEVGNCQIKGD